MDETKQALNSMANGKAMGPDKLPAELLTPGLSDNLHIILLAFHGAFHGVIVAVWMTGKVPYAAEVERRHHQSSTQKA